MNSLVLYLAVAFAAAASSAAFDDLMKEAVQDLEATGQTDPSYQRPWHSSAWLRLGAPGAAERLSLLCTGHVEPKPDVRQGNWTPATVDVARLDDRERAAVKMFMSQAFIATQACSSTFEQTSLAQDALARARPCDTRPEYVRRAFVTYVATHPEVGRRGDLENVTSEALQKVDKCGANTPGSDRQVATPSGE